MPEPLPFNPQPKPERGSAKRKRIKDSMTTASKEAVNKSKAKARDGYRCRWPHETALDREVCRREVKESSHYKAKGIGGDHGHRSKVEDSITFCRPTHQGPGSIHAGKKKVEPLDPKLKMSGPCVFFENRGTFKKPKWVEVGREIHVGVLA